MYHEAVARLGWLALLTCGAGCGLTLDLSPAPSVSADGDVGRDGAVMRDGAVLDASGVDGFGGDGGPDAGPAVSGPCGGPTVLEDDFTGGGRRAAWEAYVVGRATIEQTGGQLRVRPAASPSIFDYASYLSKFAVDLRGSWVAVEVPEAGASDPTGSASAFLNVYDATGAELTMTYTVGELAYGLLSALDVVSIPYSPTAHRWWRVREDAGTVHFEASPDGVTWNPLPGGTRPAPGWVEAAFMEIGGAYDILSDTVIAFDNFNLDGMPPRVPTTFCPAMTLVDDFDDGVLSPQWDRWLSPVAGCTADEVPGLANFTSYEGGVGECQFVTTRRFDLHGEGAFIHIPSITDYTPETGFVFEVYDLQDNWAGLAFAAGELSAYTPVAWMDLGYGGSVAYWRIRAMGTDLEMATSEDGVTYAPVVSLAAGLDTGACGMVFGVRAAAPMSRSINISVRGFNTD